MGDEVQPVAAGLGPGAVARRSSRASPAGGRPARRCRRAAARGRRRRRASPPVASSQSRTGETSAPSSWAAVWSRSARLEVVELPARGGRVDELGEARGPLALPRLGPAAGLVVGERREVVAERDEVGVVARDGAAGVGPADRRVLGRELGSRRAASRPGRACAGRRGAGRRRASSGRGAAGRPCPRAAATPRAARSRRARAGLPRAPSRPETGSSTVAGPPCRQRDP